MIILRKIEAQSFLDLIDTPTTYSGFANNYLRVKASEDALEFIPASTKTQEGIYNIPSNASSISISFNNQLPTIEYILTISLENRIDIEPSVYPILIRDKTVNGFVVDFSGEIDSNNYYLNWRISFDSPESGNSNITELSEDNSPSLSGDLNIGNNLLMLDPTPSGINIHGYDIGYSGYASDMYVSDNPTGFACPLYMQSNGSWGAACAASGIYNMPCVTLSLGEEYGEVVKVFWKGIIKKGIWNWTPGDKIYVSTVEGALTNIKPNGGSWVQFIGMAIASDTIRFDPDLTSENID